MVRVREREGVRGLQISRNVRKEIAYIRSRVRKKK